MGGKTDRGIGSRATAIGFFGGGNILEIEEQISSKRKSASAGFELNSHGSSTLLRVIVRYI
jgi:hypothetical protein